MYIDDIILPVRRGVLMRIVDGAWGAPQPNALTTLCLWALRHRIAFGPMRKPVRWLLRRVSPHCDVEIEGIRMRCWIGDNLTEQRIIERGLHKNRAGIEAITMLLRPGDTFVDVGANCGLYSLFAAKAVGAEGRVLAIEPAVQMTHRLRFNAQINEFENITVVETAVGAVTGQLPFYVIERQRGLSSLRDNGGGTEINVAVAPLLTIVEETGLDRIDAMKIDIEGYEDRAIIPFIRNAPRTLWPRRILMETSHASQWESDCLSFLTEAGYAMTKIGKADVVGHLY